MHEPTAPHESVEDSFMVDDDSDDEVCAAQLTSFISLRCWGLLVYFLFAAAGSSHALTASLHPPPAVMPGVPATML